MSQGSLMTPWGPLIKILTATESLIGICLLLPVDTSFILKPELVLLGSHLWNLIGFNDEIAK